MKPVASFQIISKRLTSDNSSYRFNVNNINSESFIFFSLWYGLCRNKGSSVMIGIFLFCSVAHPVTPFPSILPLIFPISSSSILVFIFFVLCTLLCFGPVNLFHRFSIPTKTIHISIRSSLIATTYLDPVFFHIPPVALSVVVLSMFILIAHLKNLNLLSLVLSEIVPKFRYSAYLDLHFHLSPPLFDLTLFPIIISPLFLWLSLASSRPHALLIVL